MFKKIWNWLFNYGSPNPSAIKEPPGGIDGLSYESAKRLIAKQYKLSRIDWPNRTYVEHVEKGVLSWIKKVHPNGAIDIYKPSIADKIAMDWFIITLD